jgi:hypothetical protein
MRFKSHKAWWADKKTYRAHYYDPETEKRKGIKAPIEGKRWGCTRNISTTAIEAFWQAQNKREAA